MQPGLGQAGVIQVIPPAALEAQLQQQASDKAASMQPITQPVPELAGYIRTQYEMFRNHRNTSAGWSERMLRALRAFNGQYEPSQMQEIRRWGGSEVYARIIAQKCRAASSLLRDIYLGADRPWGLRPPADPKVPDDIIQKIKQLIMTEIAMVTEQTGRPPSPADLQTRLRGLVESAKDAAKKKAREQAKDSEDSVEELLREGGYYHALAEFLIDLPIFPFACIKGPVVRVIPQVKWENGKATVKQLPKLMWQRVSPFDLWWTPGVADIANANMIEKQRLTRAEINDMLDLPGFNQEEVRAVLDEYGRGGLYDNWDTTDAERAVLENRENPAWNRSAMITMMEFNGNIQGRMLQDYGLAVEDELRDYHVQVWVIGPHVIKAHLSPSPRQRHPYFITSFEKVPGTPLGNGLTDLISDVQEVGNATLRALVNNLSISSGPQVVIDSTRLMPEENPEELYPWKRWQTRSAAGGNNSQSPIQFFQPVSNAESLIAVYKAFVEIADDVSAIPKYIGGNGGGGAGRTASGLAMLMGNASKILQTVSANVDRDVLEESLLQLYDLVLLTDDTGLLTGEESVTVLGVNVAIQRETLRQRQLEFLQTTNNPVDQHIVGLKGRGNILRSVSNTLGLDGDNIVPDEDHLAKMQEQQEQQAEDGPISAAVQKGVQTGVQMGVQLITKEITAGRLSQPEGITDMGKPAHISNAPPQPAASPGGISMHHAAAQAQGNQPGKMTTDHMGPTTNLTGHQPGPGAVPFHGGAG